MFGSDSSDGGGDLDRDMYHHHHHHQHRQQQQSQRGRSDPRPNPGGGRGGGGGGGSDYHHPRETRLFRSGGGGSAAGSDMSGLGADLAGRLRSSQSSSRSYRLLPILFRHARHCGAIAADK